MAKGWSLRARITTAATVLAAALLATIAIALVGVQRRELVANLDHTLEVRADSLLADYARNPTDAFARSNDEDRPARRGGRAPSGAGGATGIGEGGAGEG